MQFRLEMLHILDRIECLEKKKKLYQHPLHFSLHISVCHALC